MAISRNRLLEEVLNNISSEKAKEYFENLRVNLKILKQVCSTEMLHVSITLSSHIQEQVMSKIKSCLSQVAECFINKFYEKDFDLERNF